MFTGLICFLHLCHLFDFGFGAKVLLQENSVPPLKNFIRKEIVDGIKYRNHEVIFAIKMRNIEQLARTLDAISDPYSSDYGNHLTLTEIGELTSNTDGTNKVISHLNQNGITVQSQTILGELITAVASIKTWESFFDTTFYEFVRVYPSSTDDNNTTSRGLNNSNNLFSVYRATSLAVDSDIVSHISTVLNVIDFPLRVRRHIQSIHSKRTSQKKKTSSHHTDIKPSNDDNGGHKSHKFIEFNNENSKSSWHSTTNHKSPPTRLPTSAPTQPFVDPLAICSFYNIDQRSTKGLSLGSMGVYSSNGQYYSATDLRNFQSHFGLTTHPIDYDPERRECELCSYSNTCGCTTKSDDSYDDTYPCYSCPCILNPDECVESNLDVQYITGTAQDIRTAIRFEKRSTHFLVDWMNALLSDPNPPLVQSISYGSLEKDITDIGYINTVTYAMMRLGAMGVTILAASGDDGASGPGATSASECGYSPFFPAGSPYVVSIGGTMGLETRSPEVVASARNSGVYTGGGGFSTIFTAPSFQKRAIREYFSTASRKGVLPVTGYNRTGRGFPDVSLSSMSYYVFIGGTPNLLSGTSASAPVFAAMVALVNEARLAAGKPPVGWLTPALYMLNGSFTNDITCGDNKCTSKSQDSSGKVIPAVCCRQGFTATQGWDPASGFGSVDYRKFLKAMMSIPTTRTPTASPLPRSPRPSPRPTSLPTASLKRKPPTVRPTNSPTVKRIPNPTPQRTSSPSRIPRSPLSVTPSRAPTQKRSSKPVTSGPSPNPQKQGGPTSKHLKGGPTAKPLTFGPTSKPSKVVPTSKHLKGGPTAKPLIFRPLSSLS